jgi:hypothetical protein
MDEKSIYINATHYNQEALGAVARLAKRSGMSRSQAAIFLIQKGAGILPAEAEIIGIPTVKA